MRDVQIRRLVVNVTLAAAFAVAGAAFPAAVAAQGAGEVGTTPVPVENDDDGMDLGWLGLLGLAGLLGLRRRDGHHHHPRAS